MGRLFGTDGIRGLAGRPPLTSREVYLLGSIAGRVLTEKSGAKKNRMLIVRDTRWSGATIFSKLADGLRSSGIDVFDGGVLSTPSVAFLVKAHRFQSGVVISASHNPPEFNGIKFFTNHGRKWPDEWEMLVEERFFAAQKNIGKSQFSRNGVEAGQLIDAQSLDSDYEHFLLKTLEKDQDFSRLRIAVDCANGANFKIAPRVLRRLGAQVFVIGDSPNGRNINIGCGSQDTRKLAAVVRRKNCHCGIAFDGDGDRVIFTDERGALVDGDFLIALLAKEFKQSRQMPRNNVVITVMANLGLKKALHQLRLRPIEVPVGDRHVSMAMKQNGSVLGGEQSGHIILGKYLPTGDGLLTALHVLRFVNRRKKPFSQLLGWIKKFPQVLLNVPVKEKIPIPQLDGVQKTIYGVERTLGKDGRVLVRYSGTEPLLRIMLEGPNKKTLEQFGKEIAGAVKTATKSAAK